MSLTSPKPLKRLSIEASFFSQLPKAIVLKMTQGMAVQDIHAMRQLDKEMHDIANDDSVWKVKYNDHFQLGPGAQRSLNGYQARFKTSYKDDYHDLTPKEKGLFHAVKDNDLARITQLNPRIDACFIKDKQTNSIVRWAAFKKRQAVLDRFFLLVFINLFEHYNIHDLKQQVNTLMAQGYPLICWAVVYNQIEVVKTLLAIGSHAEFNELEDQPLWLATNLGHFDMVKTLIENAHLDINKQDLNGNTVLHTAIDYKRSEMIAYFISKGVNVNLTNNEHETPLIIASRCRDLETVKRLLKCNLHDLEAKTTPNGAPDFRHGMTALHWAVYRKQSKILEALMQHTPKPDMKTQNALGKLPIHTAIEGGNFNILKKLIKIDSSTIDSTNALGETPLMMVCQRGCHKRLKFLLKQNANPNLLSSGPAPGTALYFAIESGYPTLVKLLMDHIPMPNMQIGRTLIAAVKHAQLFAVEEILKKYPHEINSIDKHNNTALTWACKLGFDPIVAVLLRYDPNLEIASTYPTDEKLTPFGHAFKNKFTGIMKVLLNHKRKPNTNVPIGFKKKTPFLEGCWHGNVSLVKAMVKNVPAVLKEKDADDMSGLALACCNGLYEIVDVLLQQPNLDLDSKCVDGWCPLLYAMSAYHHKIVELLLTKKVNTKMTLGKANGTLLHRAVENDDVEIAKLILQKDPSLLTEEDARGRTPEMLARELEYSEMEDWLRASALASKAQQEPQAQAGTMVLFNAARDRQANQAVCQGLPSTLKKSMGQ